MESRRDCATLRGELKLKGDMFSRSEEEGTLLRAQNDELVVRLVQDKQRLVGEMNARRPRLSPPGGTRPGGSRSFVRA